MGAQPTDNMPASTPPPDLRDPRPAEPAAARRGYGQGRQRLLEAARQLVARHGGAHFSLRELAAAAGLGHNTIYRHFSSIDEVVQTLVEAFCADLRRGLSEARRRTPPGQLPTATVMAWLLDFALAHRDAFLIAFRERHGPHEATRRHIEAALQAIRADMLAELGALGHLPADAAERMALAVELISELSFQGCMACIWHPEQRDDILRRAVLSTQWLLSGARSG